MTPTKLLHNPQITDLSNGIKLIYLETPNDPISACHIFVRCGTWNEDNGESGVTSLLWALFHKGTKNKNAKKWAEDLESLGAHLGAGTSHDTSQFSCQAASDYFPEAMAHLGDAILNPLLAEEEIEKEKQSLMASINAKKEQSFTVAHELLNEEIYKGHPYSVPASGTVAAIKNLSQNQLRARHQQLIETPQTIISVASNIPFEAIRNLVEKNFCHSQWENIKKSSIPNPPEPPTLPARKNIREMPFEQAFIIMGVPAPSAYSEDFLPLKFLSTLLGGGMSSRLFQSLRENQGLAYDVGAYYPSKLAGSLFAIYMGLQKSRIKEAWEGIQKELTQIISKKIPLAELEQTKNYLKGSYILDHQTNSQRSYYLGWWERLGLKHEFDSQYISILDTITAEKIQKVSEKYLSQPPFIVEIHPQKQSSTNGT